jgi:pimeloyl-ACP methyl ester carboxylesterase
MKRRVVFIHGAATTGRIWRDVVPHFEDFEVSCPDRPASGDLDVEIAALADLCRHNIVVGVSGGATLGLELAARGIPLAAGVFHEPAAGSLAPGLLTHVAQGLRDGGVEGFGQALYGPSWSLDDAPDDPAIVAREFAMFSRFEPAPPGPAAGPLLLTVGAASPLSRRASVEALSRLMATPWTTVEGGAHTVHLECPGAFSAVVLAHIRTALG